MPGDTGLCQSARGSHHEPRRNLRVSLTIMTDAALTPTPNDCDLPRIRGFQENGGLRGLAADPSVIKKWRADVQIEHNGKFTNLRIVGVANYSAKEKAMLEKLAALMD